MAYTSKEEGTSIIPPGVPHLELIKPSLVHKYTVKLLFSFSFGFSFSPICELRPQNTRQFCLILHLDTMAITRD